jgi:hypothetical protein
MQVPTVIWVWCEVLPGVVTRNASMATHPEQSKVVHAQVNGFGITFAVVLIPGAMLRRNIPRYTDPISLDARPRMTVSR